jgi:hypothetical protein
MDKEQKENLKNAVPNNPKIGKVDFVAGWYYKALGVMNKNPHIQAALVSTNSIAQGEQSIIVWQDLLLNQGITINFAHQTFKWDNNGAAVFVVIIGFAKFDKPEKYLFTYEDIRGESEKISAKHINQYLIDAETVELSALNSSISGLPHMAFGTMPRDGGHFILFREEKDELSRKYPELREFIHPFIGAAEMLRNEERYILYLKDANKNLKVLQIPEIREKIKLVKEFRENSAASSTRQWASTPTLLVQDQYSRTQVLCIPRVSSEKREYAPIGYFDEKTIISDAAFQVENATLDLFALLQSKLHMAWLNTVGGRLKGDYRYSNTLVYNTFVVPELAAVEREKLISFAKQILAIREKYVREQGLSLADLYDPDLMPPDLRRAHNDNDRFVDSLYGLSRDVGDEERVAVLMKLYQQHVSGK